MAFYYREEQDGPRYEALSTTRLRAIAVEKSGSHRLRGHSRLGRDALIPHLRAFDRTMKAEADALQAMLEMRRNRPRPLDPFHELVEAVLSRTPLDDASKDTLSKAWLGADRWS